MVGGGSVAGPSGCSNNNGADLMHHHDTESDDLVLTVVKFERDRKPRTSSHSSSKDFNIQHSNI